MIARLVRWRAIKLVSAPVTLAPPPA